MRWALPRNGQDQDQSGTSGKHRVQHRVVPLYRSGPYRSLHTRSSRAGGHDAWGNTLAMRRCTRSRVLHWCKSIMTWEYAVSGD